MSTRLNYMVPGKGVLNFQCYGAASPVAGQNILAGYSAAQVLQASAPTATDQRLIMTVHNGVADYAAMTGSSCSNFKDHIYGENYVIAGNILKDASVVTSIEQAFKNTTGTLADKLMAGLLAASNIVGADSRCPTTSCASTFLRVTKPNDGLNTPSLDLRQNYITNQDPILDLYAQYKTTKTPVVGNVCYISKTKVNMEYNLDGTYMSTSGVAKLTNPANFGPHGKVPVKVNLIPINNTITASYLSSLACDVVFLGLNETAAGNFSTLPIAAQEVAEVKKWSTQLPGNTVIMGGGYMSAWGYSGTIGNNANPNVPTIQGVDFSIINGPFGNVTNVNQGGSIQGTFNPGNYGFTKILQTSGAAATNSIVIDLATQDILLSDLDLLTTLGGVTVDRTIKSQNDILFANLFAYALKSKIK